MLTDYSDVCLYLAETQEMALTQSSFQSQLEDVSHLHYHQMNDSYECLQNASSALNHNVYLRSNQLQQTKTSSVCFSIKYYTNYIEF